MSFTSLSSAWLFALIVPLVVFYFLKLKRPRQTIPSLVLWRQVMNDQRVNSPFQRFKRNLLLLLQLLLLAALVLAAMRPFLRREPQRAARLPVLVDVSASMAALDQSGGRSRLDEAKQQLGERIDAMLPEQELCIIAFSKSARKLTGFTNNKTELRDAVAALVVDDVPGALDEALHLAQALARTTPFDRVLVLTDGNLPARANFELPFQLDLQKLPSAGANIGITALNARRATSGEWEVFVQLACTANTAATTATLDLTENGQPLASEQVAIAPGNTPRLTFRLSGERALFLRASLHTSGFDALAADDTAWLRLPATRPLDVFVPESLATFRHALAALDGLRIFPSKDTPSPSSYDLAFIEKADDSRLSAQVLCSVGYVPEELRALVSMEKKSVAAIDWRRESPLLQHVSLDEVIFMDAPVTAAGKDAQSFRLLGYEVLAEGPRGPLALTRSEGGTERVHLLFHPDRSTLPYRVAFPIFISNLVQSAQRAGGLSEAIAQPTGVLRVPGFAAAASVKVSGPAQSARTEQADESGIVAGIPAPRVGEYLLASAGHEERIGASLLSPEETSLAAVDEVQFADRISVSTATLAPKADRSLWWSLAFAGFLLLLIEWWWFQRRAV